MCIRDRRGLERARRRGADALLKLEKPASRARRGRPVGRLYDDVEAEEVARAAVRAQRRTARASVGVDRAQLECERAERDLSDLRDQNAAQSTALIKATDTAQADRASRDAMLEAAQAHLDFAARTRKEAEDAAKATGSAPETNKKDDASATATATAKASSSSSSAAKNSKTTDQESTNAESQQSEADAECISAQRRLTHNHRTLILDCCACRMPAYGNNLR